MATLATSPMLIAPPGVLMPPPPPAGKSITGPGSTGTPVLPTPVISILVGASKFGFTRFTNVSAASSG
jgi:hypothetical protein